MDVQKQDSANEVDDPETVEIEGSDNQDQASSMPEPGGDVIIIK